MPKSQMSAMVDVDLRVHLSREIILASSGHHCQLFRLLTKVHLVKAMVFPVVMYGSESWTIKKAECRRIDAFELWCWRRLLRVPWTTRRSNQSILKESTLKMHWKDWCWSWSSNTLTTCCKGRLIGKDPEGKIEGKRRRGRQDEMVGWHHWLNGHEFEQTLGVGDGQGSLACCSPWGHKESDMTEWLNNKQERSFPESLSFPSSIPV